MAFDLGGLLQKYLGGNAPSATDAQAHFDEVAQNASPSILSQGLSAMFHSDQTPPFSQSASQMFSQANPNQKAGMLNQLIAGMGPAVLASLLSGAGGAAIASVLGKSASTAESPITPEQAAQEYATTPESAGTRGPKVVLCTPNAWHRRATVHGPSCV